MSDSPATFAWTASRPCRDAVAIVTDVRRYRDGPSPRTRSRQTRLT
jgi:hypothetical protein